MDERQTAYANAELVEIPAPYPEPRIVYQHAEPRKINNLTLIDGKTFLSTTLAGDIMPPGAPDVGFFLMTRGFSAAWNCVSAATAP